MIVSLSGRDQGGGIYSWYVTIQRIQLVNITDKRSKLASTDKTEYK